MFGIAGVASTGYGIHQFLSPVVAIPVAGGLFESTFVALLAGTVGLFTGLEATRREGVLRDLRLERDRLSRMFQTIPDPVAEYELRDDR